MPRHKCKRKLFRLPADESYLMEVHELNSEYKVDYEIAEVQGGNTEISLQVYEGLITPNTIRWEGLINQKSVSVLIDIGSSHNFIQEDVPKSLKLTIHAIRPFKVFTGGDEKLICDKVCKAVKISIQVTKIFMDLFLIHMYGSNVVVGIQWLKKLGWFYLNLESLSMKFSW